MNNKLWLAERIIHYEGSDVIGIFTSKDKATQACQAYESNRDDERELNFYENQTTENHPIVFIAYGANYEYTVWEVEIDKQLME